MSSSTNTQTFSDRTATPKNAHLLFLDGMRGLAALWVLLGHTFGLYRQTLLERHGAAHTGLPMWLFGWLNYPRDAVVVFIVLSGFCLGLPIMRDPNRELRGGFVAYIKRRAWRILPGYYAALALALGLIFLSHRFKQGAGMGRDDAAAFHENTNVGTIVSHLLLIHNWRSDWSSSILNVLWSVAVEWQIYFLLPFLLLPLWRKSAAHGEAVSAFVIVIAGLALGFIPTFLLPAASNLTWFHPWFVGIFAMGMAGAWAFTNIGKSPLRVILIGGGLATLLVLLALRFSITLDERISDVLVAVVTLAVIFSFHQMGDNRAGRLLLENRAVLWLGTVSYSLYLTHVLWLPRIVTLLSRFALSDAVFGIALLGLTGSVSLVAAFLFYRLFEKPFLTIRQKSSAVASPASSNVRDKPSAD